MPRWSDASDYWDPDNSPLTSKDYSPSNLYDDDEFDDLGVSPNAPAQLTDIPTSSLNAARPRTVAAGYDKTRQILTVVFRDGTVWNYSGVTEGEWQNFHASISKGRPWINNNMFGVGEPADMSGLDPQVYAAIYSAARSAQVKFKSVRRYKGESGTANVYRVGKTGAAKAKRYLNGKNPSKGGRNPYKP